MADHINNLKNIASNVNSAKVVGNYNKNHHFNINCAWRRFTKMAAPTELSVMKKHRNLAVFLFLSWPALAAFAHYTMDRDSYEHHARLELVNKNFPYMNNPNNIVYTWGTPCTIWDFECSYQHRKKVNSGELDD